MTSLVSPQATDRARLFSTLAGLGQVDLAIIGGGATGLGVALDAALRGLSVVLLESHDFAKGTSSRATKLVHGGVRYLAQGNIALVREALHERSTLLNNASHLARPLPFVMPGYKCWETPFYGTGLKIYDALAGKAGLGSTEFLNPRQTQGCIPGVRTQGLKGGVKYWDGQFDDARLALALARTAAAQGALLINYCPVTQLLHEQGRVAGLQCRDAETGDIHTLRARCVINAGGVWVDDIRRMDGSATGRDTQPMVAPSQGVHLVVDSEFFPGDHALLVPKTQDGRVLFAVPWLGKVILGTTDTPRHDLSREPLAFAEEVEFILGEAAKYLSRPPSRSDVKSIWVGLRPLVRPPENEGGNTKKISREHTVLVSPSGLVTVTGGKWTTYRAMAEDVLDKCMESALLERLPPSETADFKLVGAPAPGQGRKSLAGAPGLDAYGTEAEWLAQLPGADVELAPGLTIAMLRFAASSEYARSVEDVLARRSRLLFLDARLAQDVAPAVADILREETGVDPRLDEFLELAAQYQRLPG
ncbi:glycerol-3-phosphate dehydrogenase/oxidase [Pollutimonas sp. M17]|uniref:glycerol-3-phosphate dehydrogenase/oxidase n=1 Tax=Pollutimonas sp. M17 TaxID=2962065 RepID=UPI0021F4092F|nr:glycerol-3-phosphate dehydrogenase/oxidase [Pollutimonas sp. M17]UYO94936.1 glycerol-3-phosphate dehydrogenase/oxidase [Pollutimonas sp. M17]